MAMLISSLVHGILFADPDGLFGLANVFIEGQKVLKGFDYLIGAICIHSQQSCQPIGIACPDQSHWFPWTSRHSFDLLELGRPT
jgi:hypothetical protein